MVYPDSTTMVTVYDDIGQRRAEVDQAGISTAFGYDSLGRLVAVTNALSGVTRYFYDEVGNLTNQVDALGHATGFEHDKLGRRTKRILPAGQSETYTYDAAGNQKSHTDFNGLVITNSYDSMNRLLSRWNGASQVLGLSYSVTGQRLTMTDASGTSSYGYNNRDRLVTNSTPQGVLVYGYDSNGNVTSIQSSATNGTLLTYQYDSLNRLTNVVDGRLSGTQNTRYSFDAVGNLQTIIYPTTATNTYSYNSLNRLTNLVCKINSTTLASFAYALGASGNRTNLSETVNGTSRGYAWTYDPLYRLTNEVVSGASPTGSLGYRYDDVGNRTNRVGSLDGLGAQTLSYNSNDWLSTDTYDSNGSTTNSSGNTFRYDHDNRLTNAVVGGATITVVYDGNGHRVKKSIGGTNTLYLVDTLNPTGYAQVFEEWTVIGGTTNLARAYTYGLDLISQRQGDGTVRFYAYDGHGSTRFLSDTSGTITDTYAYDAYGNLIASTGTSTNNYLYTGEQYDPALGFYYLRARYMNPGTGRFWTMDSWEGDSESPASLHKYSYVHNDPVNSLDPIGLFTTAEQVTVAYVQSRIVEATLGVVFFAQAARIAIIDSQLRQFAQRLNVPVSKKTATEPGNMYFVHGSSTGAWLGATDIDPLRGRPDLDFGLGFYTFQDTTAGRRYAALRAQQASRRDRGIPFVLRVKITVNEYIGLSKFNFNEPANMATYSTEVGLARSGAKPFFGSDVVIGPVAKRAGNSWVPNPLLPDQFKFETLRAGAALKPVSIWYAGPTFDRF